MIYNTKLKERLIENRKVKKKEVLEPFFSLFFAFFKFLYPIYDSQIRKQDLLTRVLK